jgi:3-oxoacyl-[acyl-carrier-protein] synthase II
VSRVVVSGLGTAGPWGLGHADLLANWLAGGPATVEIDRAAGYHRPQGARRALLASGVDLAAYLSPAQARRMSPPAQLAMAATRLALADAGLEALSRDEMARTAIVVGTAFGPSWVTEQLLRQILLVGPDAASPALFTESVASAPASQVALALGARGPNLAVTAREASDLLAVVEAERLLTTGAADRVVVLVVDEMTPLLHAVLDRFRALALPDENGVERARPLAPESRGALAAEGATALVLEAATIARERGRSPWATIAAVARGFDPSAPAWGWGTGGAALAAVAGRQLARRGVELSDVDLVVSGASGVRHGDELEAALLAGLFGGSPPPIVAPKAALGAWGGGFLAAAVLATAGRAPRTAWIEACDPALGLTPRPGVAAEYPHRALVTSAGSGGAAACLVLDGGQPGRISAV